MLLSIITINRNNLDGLKKTAESVMRQTSSRYEWIVIDGASTDGSKDYIKQHAAKTAYWVSEPDSGIYNAMNKGIRQAKGDYFLFLNSGDYLTADDMVERITPELTGEDYVFANVALVDTEGRISKTSDHRRMIVDGNSFFYNSSTCHQGMFIKGDTLRIRPYDESLRFVADWEHSMVQIVENNGTFKVIDTVVAYVTEGGVSMVNEKQMERERRLVAEKHFPAATLDEMRMRNMTARRGEFTPLEISTYACAIAMRHQYDNKTYRRVFCPYSTILTRHGSRSLRLYNWCNLHGMPLIADFLAKLKSLSK